MILEGIVTSWNSEGQLNIAPMGPLVDNTTATLETFVLRPFATSRTYSNLKATGEGVLHITDDVLLLAQATIGVVNPTTVRADVVNGRRLADCCRYVEFRVEPCFEETERPSLKANAVHSGRVRDFFGFNRAKHAVLEAAILASRVRILPRDEIIAGFNRLRIPVEKTGGPHEHQAYSLLWEHVHHEISIETA